MKFSEMECPKCQRKDCLEPQQTVVHREDRFQLGDINPVSSEYQGKTTQCWCKHCREFVEVKH